MTEAERYKYWDDYFHTTDDKVASPDNLFRTVAMLTQSKDLDHAEAAIKGFLNHHGKKAEPWMYVWLAKTIGERKGPEDEVKTTLSFAAFLAKRTRNPTDLIRVADMMVIRKFYGPIGTPPKFETSIGELVDMAAEKIPANCYPPMMSMNLARETKDPKRMGDGADRLLSLGWLGLDDKMRRDVKQQVNELAKAFRDDGRSEEASALLTRLAESEARDLYVKLTWAGEADIDLTVEEPLGAIASYQNPRTVFGGAIVKNGYGNHPEEVYVCPRAFGGDYTIRVVTVFNDPAKPVAEATLEVITHEGTSEERRQTSKVDLSRPAPVVIHLTGGRRKEVLPFIAPAEPRPVAEKPKDKEKDKPKDSAKAKAAQPPAVRPAPIR